MHAKKQLCIWLSIESTQIHMAAEAGRREVKNIPQHISVQSLQPRWLMARCVVLIAVFFFFGSLFSVPSAILWEYVNFTFQLKRGSSHEVGRDFFLKWPASVSCLDETERRHGFVLADLFEKRLLQWWIWCYNVTRHLVFKDSGGSKTLALVGRWCKPALRCSVCMHACMFGSFSACGLSIIYQLYSRAFNTWLHLIYSPGCAATGGGQVIIKTSSPSCVQQMYLYIKTPWYGEKPVNINAHICKHFLFYFFLQSRTVVD